MNLGTLLNLTHLDPAALLNMTLTRSRGTGEPWDTAETDSPGSSGLLNMTLTTVDPGVLVNLDILLYLTHLDPAALENKTLHISRGTGEPWDTAEPDSLGSTGTAKHDSF